MRLFRGENRSGQTLDVLFLFVATGIKARSTVSANTDSQDNRQHTGRKADYGQALPPMFVDAGAIARPAAT